MTPENDDRYREEGWWTKPSVHRAKHEEWQRNCDMNTRNGVVHVAQKKEGETLKTGRQWFAERFAAYMEKKKISTRKLAAYIGASPDSVRCWMRGDGAPNVTHLKRLVDFTGLSADWWIGAGL